MLHRALHSLFTCSIRPLLDEQVSIPEEPRAEECERGRRQAMALARAAEVEGRCATLEQRLASVEAELHAANSARSSAEAELQAVGEAALAAAEIANQLQSSATTTAATQTSEAGVPVAGEAFEAAERAAEQAAAAEDGEKAEAARLGMLQLDAFLSLALGGGGFGPMEWRAALPEAMAKIQRATGALVSLVGDSKVVRSEREAALAERLQAWSSKAHSSLSKLHSRLDAISTKFARANGRARTGALPDNGVSLADTAAEQLEAEMKEALALHHALVREALTSVAGVNRCQRIAERITALAHLLLSALLRIFPDVTVLCMLVRRSRPSLPPRHPMGPLRACTRALGYLFFVFFASSSRHTRQEVTCEPRAGLLHL